MATRLNGAYPTRNTSGLASRSLPQGVVATPAPTPWKRNPSWLAVTAPGTSDEKFVGLHAVWPDANFLALSAAGGYTVDWGDGSATENFASGVVAYKEYDFSNANLAGTNAEVTFQGSADTVTRTAHGYVDGDLVKFYNIVTTTGITEDIPYYVRDAAADTFKVSETPGGSAVDLTNDGSGTLLPYKQVIVQVYPQAGQNLTALNLHQKHNQTGLQTYTSGFLDISVAGENLTDFRVGASAPGALTQTIRFSLLESVNIVRSDCRQLSHLFANCSALQNIANLATSTAPADLNIPVTFTDSGNVVSATNHGFRDGDNVVFTSVVSTTGIGVNLFYFVRTVTTDTFQIATTYDGAAVTLTGDGSGVAVRGTSMNRMFQNCSSLTSVPLFDTSSVTFINNMFNGCPSLTSVPLFDTSSVTNMGGMFNGCSSLTSVPLFDTSSVTSMGIMFISCPSLTSVPLFDTSSVTNMISMFNGCPSLTSVPLFDTSSVTDMSNMFQNCSSLTSVPLFNTSSVTNMGGMFQNCSSLTSVPLFNTSSVTNMGGMFNGCSSLTSVPLFDTSSVTSMASMFQSCPSLTSVPLFDTSSVTFMNNMVNGCSSLTSVPLFDTSSVTNMSSMFQNCSSLTSVPGLNLATVGSAPANMFASCASLSSNKITGLRFSLTSVAGNKMSKARLEELFANLGRFGSGTFGTTQVITVSNNFGVGVNTTKTSLSLTEGSTTISMANTSGITTGMYITGTGTGITTGRVVSSDVSADTLTLTAHGLADGTPVSFSLLGTTTGVDTGVIYFVVNATANDFQIALTAGGAAIDLTGSNASMTLRYASFVTAIDPNVSVTIDTPLASTTTQTLVFRELDASAAMLKGWAVTF
jgi:surface protein